VSATPKPFTAAIAVFTDADRKVLHQLAVETAGELAGTETEQRTRGTEWRRDVLSKRLLLLTRLATEIA
jgi:hypothetical protein